MNKKQPWWIGSKGEGYVVIQLAIFALIAFGPETAVFLPRWQGSWATLGFIIGSFLLLNGVLLVGAGIIGLGRNLTAVPHPKENATLVHTGAYSLVRHPIYSGLILLALGWGNVKGSTLIVIYALILFLFFDIKSRREEQWLCEKFPEYSDYQKQVSKLLPFLY